MVDGKMVDDNVHGYKCEKLALMYNKPYILCKLMNLENLGQMKYQNHSQIGDLMILNNIKRNRDV